MVPLRNEAEHILDLHEMICSCLTPTDLRWEVIYINEASRDSTLDLLRKIFEQDDRVKVISFNHGDRCATIEAACRSTKSEWIVTLDTRAQGAVKDLPNILSDLGPSHDLIVGWRQDPKPSFVSRLTKVLGRILSRVLAGISINDLSSEFRCFRRTVWEEVSPQGEMHRYLPILAAHQGFRVTETPVNLGPFKLKSTRRRRSQVLTGLDILAVAYHLHLSRSPFRLFGSIGLTMMFIGATLAACSIFGLFDDWGIKPIVVCALVAALGIQTTLFGLLAELVLHTRINPSKAPIESVLQHQSIDVNDDSTEDGAGSGSALPNLGRPS